MAIRTELIVMISTPRIRLPGYTLVRRGLCHLQVWGGLMPETTIWHSAHPPPVIDENPYGSSVFLAEAKIRIRGENLAFSVMSSCVGCYPQPDVIRCPIDRIGFTTLYDTGETSLKPSRGATPSRLATNRFNRPNPSFI
ncbi:hypothetical protein PIB30_083939 [Stylosanthes scabra]|uniref:Uncharacterized protein n=1 Tax=Stylosanthes scabra TaxID=79078 RepID=A0ABU6XRS0_9FABA|nr:hypothetical protein [Stylosanthes scabra]